MDTPPAVVARPLRPKSGQTVRHLAKSPLCQEQTHALQQECGPFDDLVGKG